MVVDTIDALPRLVRRHGCHAFGKEESTSGVPSNTKNDSDLDCVVVCGGRKESLAWHKGKLVVAHNVHLFARAGDVRVVVWMDVRSDCAVTRSAHVQ